MMRSITATMNVSLDGVVQGLGRPDEDTRLHLGLGEREDGNPYTARMNSVTKYVTSATLDNASAWPNSVLLPGQATQTVARLKAHYDRR